MEHTSKICYLLQLVSSSANISVDFPN